MLETKIKLNSGEKLRHDKHKSKGSMAQTDIDFYSILSENDKVVGRVVHEDHTPLDGRGRTQHVTQTDVNGKIIIQESW